MAALIYIVADHAVIGSGPAGLSCAHDLALMGYKVTVFEAAGIAGGMLHYGIPEYRLPRSLIEKEIEKITFLGAEIRYNTALSPEFGIAGLTQQGFEGVFISVGTQKGRDLSIDGAQLDGVVKAIDYLLNINNGYRVNLGRKVLVIGGGFVAFDAARTALRLGREADVDAMREEVGSETDSTLKEALDSARAALRGGARESGAGNRLLFPNQIQNDATIDVSRRFATRDSEIV